MFREKSKYIKYFIIFSIFVLLFGAMGEKSTSYNTFLRWVTFASSIFLTFKAFEKKIEWQRYTFIAVAMFFNPIIPLYLAHPSWAAALNVVVALLFTVVLFSSWGKSNNNKSKEEKKSVNINSDKQGD
ncbi:MAG: hypothetical protein Kow00103_09180 [Candidatus Caldatribacteriota bacterium]